MNFNPKIIKDDEDPIWITRLLSTNILHYRPIRIIFIASFVVCFIEFLLAVFTLCRYPSYCFKYGPYVMVEQFGFLAMITVMTQRHMYNHLWEEFDRWEFDSAGAKKEKEIAKRVWWHYLLLLSFFVAGVAFSILMLLPNPSDHETFVLIHEFDRRYPTLSSTFWIFIAKVVHGPVFYAMLMPSFMFIYGMQHGIYQGMLFMEYLKNFSSGFERFDDSELLDNAEYQKLVHERLKFCVQRHVAFDKLFKETILPIVQRLFLWFVASCTLIGIGLGMWIYALYSNILPCTLHNMAIVTNICVLALMLFWTMIHTGQVLEDESSTFLVRLMESRWPSWNKKNRTTLLLMLQNSDSFQFTFLENMSANYKIAILMGRNIYSAISLFVSFRNM